MNTKRRTTRRGFWLVESAIAIAVIGVGIVAVAGSQQAWQIQLIESDKMATGMRLATEIREMTLMLPAVDPVTGGANWGVESGEIIPMDLDDLDDLDDAIFSDSDGTGPIDATGALIVGMDDWEQRITVSCVDPFEITQTVADGASETVRIEVQTWHEGIEIARLTWLTPR